MVQVTVDTNKTEFNSTSTKNGDAKYMDHGTETSVRIRQERAASTTEFTGLCTNAQY
jgi:hypothetical protein